MHLILRFPNGRLKDALLLLRGEAVMRAVLRGRNETVELRLISGKWLTEEGERVSIEAILAGPYQGGRQTNTKNNTTAETTKTANAASFSTTAGSIN